MKVFADGGASGGLAAGAARLFWARFGALTAPLALVVIRWGEWFEFVIKVWLVVVSGAGFYGALAPMMMALAATAAYKRRTGGEGFDLDHHLSSLIPF